MARFTLFPEAREDMRDIVRSISRDNPDAARRVRAQIFEQFHTLADHPELGRERPEIGPGARAIPVGMYLIIYQVVNQKVQVVRVVHSRRDISSILNG